MLIRKSAVNEFLDRKFDDYSWMKRLSRGAIERQLRELKVRPIFKTEPWLHQLVCFYIGLYRPEFIFSLDMGLGKSKILADLITQALREKRLEKALITVPRVINVGSWADDLARHSDLEPTLIDCEDIEEKWERIQSSRGDVTVIDYSSLQWALCRKIKKKGKKGYLEPDPKRIAKVQKLYNFIGIDESHRLSNAESLWYELMKLMTERADFVYAATGTLFGSDPVEMWPQFYLIDGGQTLGENMSLFRSAFYSSSIDKFKGMVWTYNKRMAPEMHRMIQHRSIRYDEEEVDELELKGRVMRPMNMEMTDEQREHYLRAVEGIINASNGHAPEDDIQANWATLRRITSGYLKWSDGSGDHVVHFKRNPKLEALERLLEEIGNKKMVVSHEYTETGQMISRRLTELGIKHEWLYGGSSDRRGARERFMQDPACRVFLMNSAVGGTGTDGLQKVAHYMTFFESPPNPRDRRQTEKRIDRPGQNHKSFIYDLIMRRSVDKTILENIAEGRDLFELVVNGRKLTRGLFGC